VPWRLTVRAGPRVKRAWFDDLDEALATLEARVHDLVGTARREPVDVRYRRFEPVQQVTARVEVAGPQRLLAAVRAGIDVRGDGSTEAYVGRVRRRVLEQHQHESALDALRRELLGVRPDLSR
jgi:hypothetical protein